MKQFLFTIIKGVLSFIVLIFGVLLSWALILAILKSFDEALTNTDKTVILAVVSALVSIITLLLSKSIERNHAIFAEKKKINQPKYEEIILLILDPNTDKAKLKADYLPFVLTYSNDEVKEEFSLFCYNKEATADRLILAIRRELKITNKTMTKQGEKQ